MSFLLPNPEEEFAFVPKGEGAGAFEFAPKEELAGAADELAKPIEGWVPPKGDGLDADVAPNGDGLEAVVAPNGDRLDA